MKSTHKCEVVQVNLQNHPNADSLSIVNIDGYTVCVRTQDWCGQLGVYIPPDSLVDTTREEFKFLADGKSNKCRIKMKKLRGVVSMGLLIPAPPNTTLGEDLAEYFGIEHYEPELKLTMQDDNVSSPPGYYPKYDIDSLRKYTTIFEEGEPVYISEKIHGAFMRVVWIDQLYVGSRTNWKKESDTNLWWRAIKNHPEIVTFCQTHPETVLCGECYGKVQDMRYGKNDAYFMAFDIMQNQQWLAPIQFLSTCRSYNIPTVPLIKLNYLFHLDEVISMSVGQSLVQGANHCREGIVIKPMTEEWNEEIGRKILKLVGDDYYLRKEK